MNKQSFVSTHQDTSESNKNNLPRKSIIKINNINNTNNNFNVFISNYQGHFNSLNPDSNSSLNKLGVAKTKESFSKVNFKNRLSIKSLIDGTKNDQAEISKTIEVNNNKEKFNKELGINTVQSNINQASFRTISNNEKNVQSNLEHRVIPTNKNSFVSITPSNKINNPVLLTSPNNQLKLNSESYISKFKEFLMSSINKEMVKDIDMKDFIDFLYNHYGLKSNFTSNKSLIEVNTNVNSKQVL